MRDCRPARRRRPIRQSPIRLVVPFAPGGGADMMARILADPLSKRLGQPIVIENKPGARRDARRRPGREGAPDGYTLLLDHAGAADHQSVSDAEAAVRPGQGLHCRSRLLVTAVNVLVVTPSLPVKSVPELIAYAKANPGKLNSRAPASARARISSGELFKKMAGIDIVHVPYRGVGPGDAGSAGRQRPDVDRYRLGVAAAYPGRRACARSASRRSSAIRALPDLPPIADTLPGFDGSSINYISGRPECRSRSSSG